MLAAGGVRSKKKKRKKTRKTRAKKKTRKIRSTQNTPRNPQQPGARDLLETARDGTRSLQVTIKTNPLAELKHQARPAR